jgi:hypothetical protein
MRTSSGIYVEIEIQDDLDHIWLLTRDPALHERWDLRFSRIHNLPRSSSAEPQQFLYETRIGFGLNIVGTGESIGQRASAVGDTTSSRPPIQNLSSVKALDTGATFQRRAASAFSPGMTTRCALALLGGWPIGWSSGLSWVGRRPGALIASVSGRRRVGLQSRPLHSRSFMPSRDFPSALSGYGTVSCRSCSTNTSMRGRCSHRQACR